MYIGRWAVMLLVVGCGSDVQRYQAGLRSGDCGGIRDVRLKGDCLLAAAERQAAEPSAEGLCAQIVDSTLRGECWFQLAERRDDPALCPQATPFADDCALHLLSRSFAALKVTQPAEAEAEVEVRIQRTGLALDDMRPWSAWYRHVLGRQQPLDRASCAQVQAPDRQEACRMTGLALYHDRLNFARDRRIYPCDGGPLPSVLLYTPDPELDAARSSRSDLCAH